MGGRATDRRGTIGRDMEEVGTPRADGSHPPEAWCFWDEGCDFILPGLNGSVLKVWRGS